MEMILSTLTEERQLKIEVVGTLSLTGAEQLRLQFAHLAPRGLAGVEIDLARADVITSVGLSAFAVVWERAGESNIPVRFSNVSKDLVRLFEITGLRKIFLPDEPKTRGAETPGAHR